MDLVIDHHEHIPRIARAIFEEFWIDQAEYSPEVFERLLTDARTADRIPLSLVALVDRELAGTVNLIDNDDSERTHLYPWLAALLVFPSFRERGVGSALVSRLLVEAERLGYREVFFGTDAPGFYERLGAVQIERANDPIVIMKFSLPLARLSDR